MVCAWDHCGDSEKFEWGIRLESVCLEQTDFDSSSSQPGQPRIAFELVTPSLGKFSLRPSQVAPGLDEAPPDQNLLWFNGTKKVRKRVSNRLGDALFVLTMEELLSIGDFALPLK